jgi:hypothetical protein
VGLILDMASKHKSGNEAKVSMMGHTTCIQRRCGTRGGCGWVYRAYVLVIKILNMGTSSVSQHQLSFSSVPIFRRG